MTVASAIELGLAMYFVGVAIHSYAIDDELGVLVEGIAAVALVLIACGVIV
jgi:hypothetical protein